MEYKIIRAIVDTNVAVVANGNASQASLSCVKMCITRLLALREKGIVILDDQWEIIKEYQNNLHGYGQLGVGDEFLIWLLQNHENTHICEKYNIRKTNVRNNESLYFPDDPELMNFDPPDRKFVALAIVSKAPIWNAVDSDWWIYENALQKHISIENICPDALPKSR